MNFKSGHPVNAVSPGPVNTDLWLSEDGIAETIAAASGMDGRFSGFCSCSHGRSCHCRFTLPEEVAGLVTYLASPRAVHHGGQLSHRRGTSAHVLTASSRVRTSRDQKQRRKPSEFPSCSRRSLDAGYR